jgi:ribonuclease Z
MSALPPIADIYALAQEDAGGSRDNCFPNTELLVEDEMRVIALGTGTPNFRRPQASASWLVKLGSGGKVYF